MLGWILIFTLIAVSSAFAGMTDGVGFTPGMTASLVFGLLLIASVLTRALRDQA